MTSHLRVALSFASIAALLVLASAESRATPRFSLLSGTRCSACHFNPQGGGLRTELGWGAMNEVGAFRWPWQPAKASGSGGTSDEDLFNMPAEAPPEEAIPPTDAPGEESSNDGTGAVSPDGDTGLDAAGGPSDEAAAEDAPVEEIPTNVLFDGLVTPGLDVRLQVAKIGRPPNDERMLLPMQVQGYLGVTPAKWLALYGGYNYAVTQRSYLGQSSWEATVQVHPDVALPTLRLGYMQPSIGIRHEDHTTFSRREVAGGSVHAIIPPGYAELGAELSYEGMNWLTVNAGVFGSYSLAQIESIGEVTSITDVSKPSLLGRVMLWPQELDLGFNGELGASYFANGDFRMINVFGGIGMADKASFLVEGVMADFDDEHRVRNVSIMGSYLLMQWLSLNWRYEWAQTEYPLANNGAGKLAHAHQAVFGFEIFPLPFIEIRPEYRFFQTEPFNEIGGYLQGQYTVQLHLFY